MTPNLTTTKGSLLMIALWLIAVLVVVAVALSGYLSTDTRLMRYTLARAQARAWARSGVYLALQRLAAGLTPPNAKEYDWLGDEWAAPWDQSLPASAAGQSMMDGQVTIQMIDEERKLDVNAASTPQLMALGLPDDVAQEIIDAREADNPPDPAEDQPSLLPPYYAKDASFRALEELFQLPAVQAHGDEKLLRLLLQTTIYTQGKINVNTASAEVLKAVKPTVNPTLIQTFVERRGMGSDQQIGTADDCLRTNNPNSLVQLEQCLVTSTQDVTNLVSGLAFQSSVFRIVVTGKLQAPAARYQLDVIVRRGSSGQTLSAGSTLQVFGHSFEILSWKEG